MININDLFLALCRYEICGVSLPEINKNDITDEDYGFLYKLAKHHDCAHLVSDALFKNGLIAKEDSHYEAFKKAQMKAYYRYERISFELCQVSDALATAEVSFIPLKGSYLRRFYPEPWMRTSADIDILVHEEQLETAINVLKENLGYSYRERGSHDVAFVSKSGLLVELHFDLIEEARYPEAVKILSSAWDYAVSDENSKFSYTLSDEMFYYYHIAHMVKHFENGGCGVRSFIDLWILENRIKHDENARNELLQKGRLLDFTNAARSLADVWFSGKEASEIDLQMQSFILKGGTFGTTDSGAMVKLAKKGGSTKKYVLSRLFLPMSMMKSQHPVLKKHPYLLPIFYIKRLAKLFNKETRQRAKVQLSAVGSDNQAEAESTAELLKKIGL